MASATNYFAWQGRLVTSELGRRVLEVGCGLGNFTGLLLDREAVVALDVEPACIERLRERYPDRPNLHAFVCDAGVSDFAEARRFRPDSCVCLNVLEHIEDDCGMLRRVASVLEPGGRIVLLLPAFPALYGPIDRNLGHYRRYTRGSVRRLAAAAGLHLSKARYMNSVGFFGWWANSHIFRREAQSEGQIRIFDRYVAPLMSRVEELAPPPFGQSLFVVLARP
jgi:2-polyprenyl-3-methyl-5-hydroxy-6-metoxy-1,4-benzoquinol methylase